ncbi:MAG: nucleotide sugar dehydrogenase [Coriobacteriia bacterium]|nr:nucleotide sugar dehydrogenase [Coriobacteriia bacterium]
MKIVVAGMGYVGLSIACLLAQKNSVYAVDIIEEKTERINKRMPIFADDDIERFYASKDLDLQATTRLSETFADADFLVIATPTDYDDVLNHFDTSSIESVLSEASQYFTKAVVVIKSTLPVAYTDKLCEDFPNMRILFSPEFLREGQALYDNLNPSRIIVGVPAGHAELVPDAKAFAGLLAEGAAADRPDGIASPVIPELIVGAAEAEAIKLFANTYLALRVSYFNELDTFAEMRGLSTAEIIEGVSLDPRIGDYYNNPSFGYGGYCLPKDTKQLLANYHSVPQNLIQAIVQANQTRMDYIVSQIIEKNPKLVGIHRLIMKSNSDNFRQSSIQGIMERLKNKGIPFLVYEPLLDENTAYEFEYTKDLQLLKDECDLIIANRASDDLKDVMHKTYSRDLWQRD